MANITLTIQNLETWETDAFTYPMEQDDFTEKYAALLPNGEDYEVVDIEIEDSDMPNEVEEAFKRYADFSIMPDSMEKTIDIMEKLEDATCSPSWSVETWNEYCDDTGYYDDRIMPFDEYTLDEFFASTYDAVRACVCGSVNLNDEYFKFNGYGNVVTSSYPMEDFMDVYDMVKWFIEREEAEEQGLL